MALIPILFHDWFTDDDIFNRSSRLMNQHCGFNNYDILPSSFPVRSCLRNSYLRPWLSELQHDVNSSTVKQDKDKFQVILDVQQFTPNEITVKVNKENSSVTVEGKHEEKQDEHGFISRHFVRRYVLPKDNDIDAVTSSLSSDGVLTITSPQKNKPIEEAGQERTIPITQTGSANTSKESK